MRNWKQIWDGLSEGISGLLAVLLLIIPITAVGVVAGGAIGAVSAYTVIGAIVLSVVFLAAVVVVIVFMRAVFMILGFILALVVQLLAHPSGYNLIALGEEIGRKMTRWTACVASLSLVSGVAAGIYLVRHIF